MDSKKQKLNIWNKKLVDLETRLVETMIKRGEAMAMGDLRENAAFQDADEEASVLRTRIDEMRKIIAKIEDDGKKGTN